ncbi:anti-phage dCTP deaminase, partial [Rhodopirellula sallentina]
MSDNNFESELVIGLVGAVGTEMSQVIELLEEPFRLAGYESKIIKVSKEVIPLLVDTDPSPQDQFKRITDLMDAGNRARGATVDNGVLSSGVATLIYNDRPKRDRKPEPKYRRVVIVDSLKRPEEVERLRTIYSGGFVLVGIHSEEDQRIDNLVRNRGINQEDAIELVRRDRDETSVPSGQRLNRTFHLADFFVRINENRERLRQDLRRMVELWFGNPYHTPTFDEFAMYMAFSAALRSADLSRQVGAVIAREQTILATGANDCPRPGGGLYWPERDETHRISDQPLGRDHTRERDSNRTEQLAIMGELADRLRERGMDRDSAIKILSSSRLADLTEFGRMVHAEMEAILSCGRLGIATTGTTLYSTTFPCHNCAKHIVAAGIGRVVYVEPYPKSRALDLHDDSISVNSAGEANKVGFEPFVGIGPR